MKINDIQDKAKECQHYAFESGEHACKRSQFIANTCFAFDNRDIPDICSYFPADSKITEAKIDSIWSTERKVKRSKYDCKLKLQILIMNLLENKKTFTQKEIIKKAKELSPSVIKYHWQAVMNQLGLRWELRYEGRAHSKEYKIKWREFRVLKRRLKNA